MANWHWYGQHVAGQWGANPVTSGAELKILLTTPAYTPNQASDRVRSNVTSEVAGRGYTPGGLSVGEWSVTYDAGSNETRLNFTGPVWGPDASIPRIGAAVLYASTGGSSRDPLVAYAVFDNEVSVVNGTFSLDVDPTAVLKIIIA